MKKFKEMSNLLKIDKVSISTSYVDACTARVMSNRSDKNKRSHITFFFNYLL